MSDYGQDNMEDIIKEEKEICCVCDKEMINNDDWECEICGNGHHEKCSGENSPGTGEYPDEDAYSICQKCIDKNKEKDSGSSGK